MYFDYDFLYVTDLGKKVSIAVSYFYEEADPYALTSDWDRNGGFFIDKVEITENGKVFEGYISPEEIQRELFIRLREEAIEKVMMDNEGF